MKKKDIKINGVYAVKVGRNVTGVRIMKENPHGGWDGVNLSTNKAVRIKSPARLRGPWKPRAATKSPTSAPVAKTEPKPTKATKTKTTKRDSEGKKPGVLDAAVKVLTEVGQPLSCGDMMKIMLEKGYWTTNGKTPAATLYAAIIREIATSIQKAEKSRFRKVERGKFTLNK